MIENRDPDDQMGIGQTEDMVRAGARRRGVLGIKLQFQKLDPTGFARAASTSGKAADVGLLSQSWTVRLYRETLHAGPSALTR